jgi:hypothetical protein
MLANGRPKFRSGYQNGRVNFIHAHSKRSQPARVRQVSVRLEGEVRLRKVDPQDEGVTMS